MQIQAIPEKIWDQLSEPDGEAIEMAFSALEAQELSNNSPKLDSGNGELISRQDALSFLRNWERVKDYSWGERNIIKATINEIESLPSAQPTLCGYDIEHLILIANVLRKENLPPERVIEILTDIGRIVSIVTDEFKESLRKAVEQCKI